MPITSQCDLKFDLKAKVTVAYVQRSPYFNSYLLKISNAWSALLSENNSFKMMYWFNIVTPYLTGLGGSVGCSVRLETRRSRVQPLPRSATFFRGD